eukprot:Nitzschia sp. Nitz4//scaffold38_size140716//119027//120700//NITZ4_003169-RA/size140716-processed-gene-0.44-mRNA-1//1//CDS//3329550144//167//frame0
MTETKGEPAPPTKKRRRAPQSKKADVKAEAPVSQPLSPPTHTLIIDNGGDTIKYGWSTDEHPKSIPNVTARLAHQITLLVGDELSQVQNPNSLVAVTRNMERGLISDMGNQTQVWKRLLDWMGVIIPLQSEAATALGWKAAASRAAKASQGNLPPKTIPASSVAVVILVPPHCPRLLLDQIVYIWMEDFGVSYVGFGNSAVFAGEEHATFKTCCTVDMGWSSTTIVPTFKQKAIQPEAVRRLPIGGRHLVNILKYYMSYRQYNLMDQEHLLRDVLQKLAYVSLDLEGDLKVARSKNSGLRPFDRDYILPDYQSTHEGQIRLPPALERALEQAKNPAQKEDSEDDEEEDEDFAADDSNDESDDGNDNEEDRETTNANKNDDSSDDEDEEEESPEQRQKRQLQAKAEEERRRREQAEAEQVLRVSTERFVIPEVLFHPADAGMTADLLGLAPAIVQAIEKCPEHFQPALYQRIFLVGGLSQIPNLKARLERELRSLAPSEYDLHVELSETPVNQAWLGAKKWVNGTSYTNWSINREEWVSSGKRKAYGRLLLSNGGNCI